MLPTPGVRRRTNDARAYRAAGVGRAACCAGAGSAKVGVAARSVTERILGAWDDEPFWA